MPIGTILIRADASVTIGTGHVMRCLALAQRWREAEGEAVFVTTESTSPLLQRLQSEGFEVVSLDTVPGSMDDAGELLRLAVTRKADWVIVDGYRFMSDYQRKIKNSPRKLMVVDDNGEAGTYSADLVVNQNIHATDELYSRREPYTRLLLGTNYAMLRREFTEWKDWKREIVPSARRILLTMGGSDPENVTAQAVRALRLLEGKGLEVIAVVGGSNPHMRSIQEAASEFEGKLTLRSNVGNMPILMAWADVAISAAGSTCWEICHLGLPAIIVPIAENQVALSIRLEELGTVEVVNNSANFIDELSRKAQRLIGSPQTRSAMSRIGRELVDGDGTRRVVEAILETADGGGTHVLPA